MCSLFVQRSNSLIKHNDQITSISVKEAETEDTLSSVSVSLGRQNHVVSLIHAKKLNLMVKLVLFQVQNEHTLYVSVVKKQIKPW